MAWLKEQLISPYPTRDFTRLQPGTMLIVLNVEFP